MMIRYQTLKAVGFWPQYGILKTIGNQQKVEKVNPFRSKPFPELERILDTSTATHNRVSLYNLLLKAIMAKINEEAGKKTLTTIKPQAKEELFNKCMGKMMREMDHLGAQDIIDLAEIILLCQDNRELKLSKQNFISFTQVLPKHVEKLLKSDPDGRHKDKFYEMLVLFLNIRTQANIIKQSIEYLYRVGLNNNQEILRFFKDVSDSKRGSAYDLIMEKIVLRFIEINKETSDPVEWIDFVFMDIVLQCDLSFKSSMNQPITRFLDGLKLCVERGQIDLEKKVVFFSSLGQLILTDSPYRSNTQKQKQKIVFFYQLFQSITKECQEQTHCMTDTIIKIKEVSDIALSVFSRHCMVLGRSVSSLQGEVKSLLDYLYNQAFSVQKKEHISRLQMSSLITKTYELSEGTEKKIVEFLIAYLKTEDDIKTLILRIRFYEYIAYKIKEGKLQIQKEEFVSEMLKIEKEAANLDQFLVVRFYNVMRVIGLRTRVLTGYFEHICNKNQSGVVENLSRTILRQYSFDLIKQNSDRLVQKIKRGHKINTFNSQKCIWMSLKTPDTYWNDNSDQMYYYWFHHNIDIVERVTSTSEGPDFVKYMIKELKSRSSFPSIRAEVLIEYLRFFHLQQNQLKMGTQESFLENSLRIIGQSQIVKNLLAGEHRHSFLAKLLWSFYLLFKNYNMKKLQQKPYLLIKQLIRYLRTNMISSVRERRDDLKKTICLKVLKQVNFQQQMRMGHQTHVAEAWLWANINNLSLQMKFKGGSHFYEYIEEQIIKNYGVSHLVEFKIAHSSSPQLTDFSNQLIQNTIFHSILNQADWQKDGGSCLLDLLIFPRTIQLFFNQKNNFIEDYFKKLTTLQIVLNSNKLISVYNLFSKYKGKISAEVRDRLWEWIAKNMRKLYDLQYQDFPALCLKLNYQPEYGRGVIDQYLNTQLRSGNFFLVSLLYANAQIGINEGLAELLKLTEINRVMLFFHGDLYSELFMFFNQCLGLVLLQNDEPLLQYFLVTYSRYLMNREVVQQKESYAQQNQLYILGRVAKSRLKSEKGQYQVIKILEKLGNIEARVLEWINKRNFVAINAQNLDSYKLEQTTFDHLSLFKIKQKYVMLQDHSVGYSLLAVQFLNLLAGSDSFICMKGSELSKLQTS